MSQAALILQVSGLAKTKLERLRKLAKQSGLSAEGFAKQLIEDGLSIREKARSTSFDDLLGTVRAKAQRDGVGDSELDRIVDAARTRHHKRGTKKRS